MYQDRTFGDADQPLVPAAGEPPTAPSPLERLSRSVPGAIAGVVLMSALAFGAGAVHAPGTTEPAGYTGAHGDRPTTNGGAEYGGAFPGGYTTYPVADLNGATTGDGDGLANGDGQGTDAAGDPNDGPDGQPGGDAKDGAAPSRFCPLRSVSTVTGPGRGLSCHNPCHTFLENKSHLRDLNPGPMLYESIALPLS